MINEVHQTGLVRELEEAGLLLDGHFAYRSGIHSLRLLDRDRALSDTHLASRLGYALAKRFFLTRVDIIATPSIWGAGLAQWIGYFLDPRRTVIYARQEDGEFLFTPGPESIDGRRVLIVDNFLLTGGTMQTFAQTITKLGGTPIGVATLANLSGLDWPIDVVSLFNEELDLFDPKEEPGKGSATPVVEVGY